MCNSYKEQTDVDVNFDKTNSNKKLDLPQMQIQTSNLHYLRHQTTEFILLHNSSKTFLPRRVAGVSTTKFFTRYLIDIRIFTRLERTGGQRYDKVSLPDRTASHSVRVPRSHVAGTRDDTCLSHPRYHNNILHLGTVFLSTYNIIISLIFVYLSTSLESFIPLLLLQLEQMRL